MTRFILCPLLATLLCAGCAQTTALAPHAAPLSNANAAPLNDPHAAWSLHQGGLLTGPESAAAQSALDRVGSQLTGPPLRAFVLRSSEPVAYSFPDGSIYLSAALVHALSPDQLAAVVAHELGHLLHDKLLTSPAALRGDTPAGANADIETAADMLARQILIAHHIPSASLADALTIIADRSRNTPWEPALRARAAHQRTLDTP